ncbi:3-deoxy-D-manno-octulosonic acid transferase [Hanstruepera ponticola]|uniref:3-deoxy-D-manno-octulosonic acid transferase n=1 Tax=Hanstruepera ponticola TaxID=2042995 RepID=UPI000CF0C00D|nr:glycosyltransferase N-terminal domain-containing protein [Hanstruepera ponticola]
MYFSNKVQNLNIIYNIAIGLTERLLKFIVLFNQKIKFGVEGRSQTFSTLRNTIQATDKCIWFHCASLGEYEQGLPVFKEIKKLYKSHKIILTFFSPSGYEIRKNTEIADAVLYLPIDTKQNAKRFVNHINPELTVFVKYDIWPNYLNELKKIKGRAILISALFRKNQSYFKWYGRFMRDTLFAFEHIFTQDDKSKKLLKTIGYHNTSVSGDTRFDRVYSQLEQNNSLDFVSEFKAENLCFVAGSTWPEDEDILVDYINISTDTTKFIIAPHNIKSAQIQKLKQSIKKKTILFSEKEGALLHDFQVLIVDTIGLLSKIYFYADIAYVGGAIGTTGLHNILEPAVFGVPVIIGNNHKKFPEAARMIKNAGVLEIKDVEGFKLIMSTLYENKTFLSALGEKNSDFIKKNTGAVVQIMDYLRI